MATYIGQIKVGGNTLPVGSTLYGTCSTAAGTAAKVVTLANFDNLTIGVTIHVKFTNSNTAANPTLNVNSTGAKNIYRYGTTAPSTTAATSWNAGAVVSFTYDGTYWQMNDWVNSDTTYSASNGVSLSGTTFSNSGVRSISSSSSNGGLSVNTNGTTADVYPKGFENGYVNTHPENTPVIIPFINNDIAHVARRGGSVVVTFDGVTQTSDVNPMFDGSGSYFSVNSTTVSKVVVEVTSYTTHTWTSTIYADFGHSNWRAKDTKIEVVNTAYTSDVWTEKYHNTNVAQGHCYVTFSHTPVGASNAGGGFNKIRFTFTDFATSGTSHFRISQLGVINYSSTGLRQPYMSRGLDDYVFRNITPNANNTYALGSSSYKWSNVYATTFNGSLSGTATTATNVATQGAATANEGRHVWFSAGTETMRSHNDSFKYNPSTNTITANTSGNAANVTGTVAVDHGGTGLTSSPSMLTNLGSTTAANVLTATPRPGVTGTLAVGNGGTGLTSSPSMLTNVGSTTAANILTATPRPGVTGTLAVGNGGTGKTTAKDACNDFINALDTQGTTPVDADYIVAQYANGGTTTKTYHRKSMSVLWTYIKGKIESVVLSTSTSSSSTTTAATSSAVKAAYDHVKDATLTIQKNGSTVKTFTANASSNVTANITVPTKTSDLTNDSGFSTNLIGEIKIWAGNTVPTGWLLCDGTAVSRTDYSALFTAIGTLWGTGDGSTTFNLPNLNGKVPVGYHSGDTDFDTVGERGGDKTHTHTTGDFTLGTNHIPAHTHGAKLTNGSIRFYKGNQATTASGSITFSDKTNRQYSQDGTASNSWQTATFALNHTHTSVGGGQAHNHGATGDGSNLQPYAVVKYIICAA